MGAGASVKSTEEESPGQKKRSSCRAEMRARNLRDSLKSNGSLNDAKFETRTSLPEDVEPPEDRSPSKTSVTSTTASSSDGLEMPRIPMERSFSKNSRISTSSEKKSGDGWSSSRAEMRVRNYKASAGVKRASNTGSRNGTGSPPMANAAELEADERDASTKAQDGIVVVAPTVLPRISPSSSREAEKNVDKVTPWSSCPPTRLDSTHSCSRAEMRVRNFKAAMAPQANRVSVTGRR